MTLPGLGTLVEIISALNTQLDPLATQQARLATYDQLNSILSSPHAAAIGLALSPAVDPATNTPAQPDHVRFFGLKCLEYAIKYQWASLAEDARQATRAGIEALATHGMASTGEPVIIKSKLAAVLAEVAKRDWPGVFDLNALLTSMFSLSPTHRELVFLTLTALCEDVYNVDFADEVVLARKRELMKALSSIVLSDEVYTKSVLMRDLAPFRAAVKEVIYIPGEQGRLGWFLVAVNHLQPFAVQAVANKEEVGMAVAALRALSTMVPWVPSDLMVDANVLAGLAQILSVRGHALQITYAAAEVLFLITQRNYPATGEVELMFSWFVDGGLVAPIVQCLYALDSTDADAFDVMKLLVQALVDVCVRQIAGKANTTGWVPERLAEYIAAVLELQQHPSVTLSSSILGVWLTALKHEQLKKAPPVLEALPRVLEKAVTTFERKLPLDEFPNKKTRERAMASLLSQTKTMVKLVAAMSPTDSAQWLHSQLSSGHHLHGIMTMIEAAAPELYKCPSGLLAVYQNLLSRLATVVSNTPGPSPDKDAAVLSHVRTAAACVGAIGSDMQQLLPLIQAVITYAPNDRSIRYHLLAQLAKVALAVPDLVFSLSSDIEAASHTLPMAEVCHVVETQLVAILHTTKLASREERTAAVRAIFDPLLMGFCSHVDKVLPTPQSLPDICQPANEHHREQRSQVMLPMVALNASLKRAAASSMPDVLDVYVPEVSQRVLRVVQCAHAVTDVEWGKRDPVVKMLQGVPHTIKTSYLLTAHSDDGLDPAQRQQMESQKATLKVQMWLEQLKPNSYTLLGHLLRPTFYQLPNIAQLIISHVFSHIDSVENRHLAALLKCLVEPLVANCPPEMRGAVLPQIVPELCRFVGARLDREWAKQASALGADGTGMPHGPEGADDEEDDDDDNDDDNKELSAEIVADRQLRSLTIGVIDMFSAWFVQNRKRQHHAAAHQPPQQSLAEYVFAEVNTMLEPVLALLTAPGRWGEPTAVTKAMAALKALLPQFSGRRDRQSILAGYVIRGVLTTLRSPVHADVYDAVIAFVAHALAVLLNPAEPQVAQETLGVLVTEGVPQEAVMRFAQAWPTFTVEGDRERAVRSVLSPITNVAVGEAGKVQKSAAVVMVNKVMIAPQKEANDPEEEVYELLGNLFDESNELDMLSFEGSV